jgi:hypothetical protein
VTNIDSIIWTAQQGTGLGYDAFAANSEGSTPQTNQPF